MEFKIRFSGTGHRYTDEEVALVAEVMQQAEPLTQGKYRGAFEARFAEHVGVEHAFAVCNATAALEMAAQLCQFRAGDEVVAPTHTFTASVYPFLKKGARPVWADIDPATRVVTAETLAAAVTPATKALIVPHLYGYMVDMESVMELARKRGLIVIEDVAQALGTEINGKKAGSFGDFSIFSFHSHKNITTLGEGGMLVVKDPQTAEVVPMLRHNGHCAFDFEREDYWIPAMGNVDFPELNGERLWPNNFCLGEVECALGEKLLDRSDEINAAKRRRALDFIDALAAHPELEFHRVPSTRHNYHLLAARMTNGLRDEFMRKMAYEHGVQCVVQYQLLHRYDFYRKFGAGKADCPNSELFFDNMVSFPFHHWLSDDDLQYMLDKTRETLTAI